MSDNTKVEMAQVKLFLSEKSCVDTYRTFDDVMNPISFVISSVAFFILTREVKNRHFPHNVPTLMCLSLALYSLSHVISQIYRGSTIESSFSLCVFQAQSANIGLATAFWIWVTSFVVLYFATVVQVPTRVLRQKRLYYYVITGIILIFVSGAPPIFGTFTFSPLVQYCYISMTTEWLMTLFGSAWVAGIVALLVIPQIVRSLLPRETHLLPHHRVLMLRAEAIRQVVLSVIMCLASIFSGYRYGIAIWILRSAGPTNQMLQSLSYTSCALDTILVRQLGTYVGLIYLFRHDNVEIVKNMFDKLVSTYYNESNHFATIWEQVEYSEIDDGLSYDSAETPKRMRNAMSVNEERLSRISAGPPKEYYDRLLKRVQHHLALDGILMRKDTQSIVEEVAESTFIDDGNNNSNEMSSTNAVLIDAQVEAAKMKWYSAYMESSIHSTPDTTDSIL